ncbi:UNVERIFIED_CONTAM: hypothetical protein PYX00_002728 [Menopon gallinae]|uniref:Uncharacterized protein n=1 Tax=Menopon gallinae TaxID=328185 RepID=A0AAW2HYX2_9NEOP
MESATFSNAISMYNVIGRSDVVTCLPIFFPDRGKVKRAKMPKNKHKKHESESVKDRNSTNEEETDQDNREETVSDGKYGRRKIQSNWDRYEEPPPTSEEQPKASDFETLLKAPSMCTYFQFKSEKNWETEAAKSSFSGQKFFELDLEVLAKGLACIPFYERASIDKSVLTQSDIDACDKKARDSEDRYKSVKERFLKKLERDCQLPDLIHKERERDSPPINQVPATNLAPDEEKIAQNVINVLSSDKSKVCSEVENNGDDENLEDWLDSVLDN